MHYLTSLVLIESSRARGAAIEAELRRGYSTERGGRCGFAVLQDRKENKMKRLSNRWLLAALTLLIAARVAAIGSRALASCGPS
jgi:hypothetical protein